LICVGLEFLQPSFSSSHKVLNSMENDNDEMQLVFGSPNCFMVETTISWLENNRHY